MNTNKKHLVEAKKAGLILVGPARSVSYRTYRFLTCNHKQEIGLKDVRKNNFRCRTCLHKKLVREARAVGLMLLGNGRNSSYRCYKFKKCGHEFQFQPQHVRVSNIKCQLCHEEKLQAEAKANNLEIIGEGSRYNLSSRLYRFKKCGHEREYQVDNVRRQKPRCIECYENELIAEARKVGLEYRG